MDNTTYISLSNQAALRRRMDLIANNIANMNTTGFKTEHPVFEDYLIKPDPFERKATYNYAADIGMYRQFNDGQHIHTDNPLDVALSGPGFLKVEKENGDVNYTRNGQMSLNELGTLVDRNGHAILDDGDTAIIIAPGTKDISIGQDGTISTENGAIAKIGMFEFANPQSLKKIGNNLYLATEDEIFADSTILSQGYIEASNVNPVMEMADMIALQRTYESTQRMVEQEHDRKTNYIQRISRMSR
jgi:flagellar basal-body rod protein FlgF